MTKPGENDNCIKVALFCSNTLITEALKSIISRDNDIKITGLAASRTELAYILTESRPHISLIHTDRENLKSLIKDINTISTNNHEEYNTKIVLIINEYDETSELEFLEAGVRGYLPESRATTDLTRALKAVQNGERWARRIVMGTFVDKILLKKKAGEYSEPNELFLAKKELQIIVYVNKGMRNKEIASRLFISENTVKHYLYKIFKKLGVKHRYEIKRYFD